MVMSFTIWLTLWVLADFGTKGNEMNELVRGISIGGIVCGFALIVNSILKTLERLAEFFNQFDYLFNRSESNGKADNTREV
jgi:hypothetical protein